MRLGGRLSAAMEVLADIEEHRRPASAALKDWGLSHRFAGSGDRAAIGNIVYDSLRRKRSVGHAMGSDRPSALATGTLLCHWNYTLDSLDAALEGDKFAPEPLGEEERASFAAFSDGKRDRPDEPVRGDVPDWTAPLFAATFGPDWVDEAAALGDRPSLDMRANTLKADRDKVAEALKRFSLDLPDHPANTLRIAPGAGAERLPHVESDAAYQKGWFEVQDAGSQTVAALCQAAPGEQVLDFCAGAGGKALALSAAMENRGQIHAYDRDRRRLAPIHERLRRAGARNVQVHEPGAEMNALEGAMDLVVVDAPCTGSGTWRRRPDAKWRLTARSLEDRCREQGEVLDQAAAFVRPGGRLVYITCSLFAAENQDQISAFLGRHQGFVPIDGSTIWDEVMPGIDAPMIDGAGITLSPKTTGTDGFFFTALRREGEKA